MPGAWSYERPFQSTPKVMFSPIAVAGASSSPSSTRPTQVSDSTAEARVQVMVRATGSQVPSAELGLESPAGTRTVRVEPAATPMMPKFSRKVERQAVIV